MMADITVADTTKPVTGIWSVQAPIFSEDDREEFWRLADEMTLPPQHGDTIRLTSGTVMVFGKWEGA
jgi:hypothetical protein